MQSGSRRTTEGTKPRLRPTNGPPPGTHRERVDLLRAEDLEGYWRGLHAQRGTADDLEIVCLPGAPAWLNRYVAETQQRIFTGMLGEIGSLEGAHVLDVGCGTGRWSQLLRDRGADVLAIDISPEAIESNRQRISGIEFRVADLARPDLPDDAFDLIASVTVLQHLPPDGQQSASAALARALRPGGYALLLENIRDHGPHVFSRRIEQWVDLFRRVGLSPCRVAGYSFDLPLRVATVPIAAWGALSRCSGRIDTALPITVRGPQGKARQSRRMDLYWQFVYRPLGWLSREMELVSEKFLPSGMATHAAFLLRRSAET
jgi:SAM-dependent methyltransferase